MWLHNRFDYPLTREYIKDTYSRHFDESATPPEICYPLSKSRFISKTSISLHPIIELCKNGAFKDLENCPSDKLEKMISDIVHKKIWIGDLMYGKRLREIEIPKIYFELLKSPNLAERALNFQICRKLFLFKDRPTLETYNNNLFSIGAVCGFLFLGYILGRAFALDYRFLLKSKRTWSRLFEGLCLTTVISAMGGLFTGGVFCATVNKIAHYIKRENPNQVIDLAAVKATNDLDGAKYYLVSKKALFPKKASYYEKRIQFLEANFQPTLIDQLQPTPKIDPIPESAPKPTSLIAKIKSIFWKLIYFILSFFRIGARQ